MGKATRDAFGETLRDLGRTNPDIVVLDGDVNNSTRTEWFAKEFPDRFFNVGIAESNLVGIAGGLASCGKIPVVASFACFIMCNAFDQLRMSVAFPQLNVKICGSHAGISIGEDGPSQMGIEDVALAMALPGFAVLVPADEAETREVVRAALEHRGPVYIRTGRSPVPLVYDQGCEFRIGRANWLRDGDDVTLIADGLMVAAALDAADQLAREGTRARVLDMASVRPLDEDAIAAAVRETRGIVVAAEHLRWGGLGAAVAMAAAQHGACPMRFVALDAYAASGKPAELLEKYGLTAAHIAHAAQELVAARA